MALVFPQNKESESRLRSKYQVEIQRFRASDVRRLALSPWWIRDGFMMACAESPLLGRKMRRQCGVRVSKAVVSKLIGCHSNIRDGPQGWCVCVCLSASVPESVFVTTLQPFPIKITDLVGTRRLYEDQSPSWCGNTSFLRTDCRFRFTSKQIQLLIVNLHTLFNIYLLHFYWTYSNSLLQSRCIITATSTALTASLQNWSTWKQGEVNGSFINQSW